MKTHKSNMTCTASTNPNLFAVGQKYEAEGNATDGGYVKCRIGMEHRITPTHTITQSLYIHTSGADRFIFQIRG